MHNTTISLIEKIGLGNGKPKMELCHRHGGGRLLVDLLDAHALGELKIELCHHHGGGRLLVDL